MIRQGDVAGSFVAVNGSADSLLPPGTYYIQMIYYGVFLRHYHEGTKYGQQLDEWKASDKKELFRSNVVKIDLVDN